MSDTVSENTLALKRLEKKPLPRFSSALLPLLALLSCVLLLLALLSLLDANSVVDWLKCAVIAASAGVSAYAVNRYALEKGAPQAAIGSVTAAIASLASILVVGAGLAMATYAGLVIEETDRVRLSGFTAEFSAWTDAQKETLSTGSRLAPLLGVFENDLAAKAACERTTSCVSGVGNGGVGPAARQLEGALGSLRATEQQLSGAVNRQSVALTEVNALQTALQGLLGSNDLSGAERRTQFEELVRAVPGALTNVSSASPRDLLEGLSSQLLQFGTLLPQDRLLHGYGEQLAATLSTKAVRPTPPEVPGPTGVSDTLRYIGHFLPVALLVAVIEMILPITLWAYIFVALRAQLEELERDELKPVRRRAQAKPRINGGDNAQITRN